jgi:hypothetical protein
MNVEEMATLLGTISLIDPRVSRRDDQEKILMAKAWLVVVGDRVPFEFAARCAQEHYRNSDKVFMPVNICSNWKIESERLHLVEQAENEAREIESRRSQAVPMPDYLKEQIEAFGVIPPEKKKELPPETLQEIAEKKRASELWLANNV